MTGGGSFLAKIVFYPSLGFNILMTKISSRRWYDRIDDTVILGALPLKSWNKILVEEENVRAVVTMNEEWETKGLTNSYEEWKEMGVEQLTLPTVDLTATPTQEKIHEGVSFIMKHRKLNNTVYVHCKAGRTRSTTIVACYLMKVNNMKPQEAVDFIQSKRPHIWLRDKQMDSIRDFYKTLHTGNTNGA